ncbi:MAG: efflux transporter outer membrane subunit, partial [Burkholderiales bacterium]
MGRRQRAAIAAVAAALLAAGCASFGGLAPRAQPADAANLAARATLADAKLSNAAWPAADWWRRFGDPQLDALIAEALA